MRAIQALLVAVCAANPIAAEPVTCADPSFQVSGGDADARDRACQVASEARGSLAACNVTINSGVKIDIVETLETAAADCLGLYHCGEDRIEILSPKAMSTMRDKEGVFELIEDAPYWNSVLVHELTHAAYDAVECPFTSCIATSEYAAYVMQVRSLPEDQRTLFGKTVNLKTKPGFEAISSMMLFLSPSHFAKIAWLHFQGLDDPCGYMGFVMNGQIIFDHEPL